MKMEIQSEKLEAKVIGKTQETKGLLFKKPAYTIAIQLTDSRVIRAEILEREVSFCQYSSFNVGDLINVILYTFDRKHWYASRDEAEIDQGGII